MYQRFLGPNNFVIQYVWGPGIYICKSHVFLMLYHIYHSSAGNNANKKTEKSLPEKYRDAGILNWNCGRMKRVSI